MSSSAQPEQMLSLYWERNKADFYLWIHDLIKRRVEEEVRDRLSHLSPADVAVPVSSGVYGVPVSVPDRILSECGAHAPPALVLESGITQAQPLTAK